MAIVLCFILGRVYWCVKRRRRSSRPLTPRVRAGELSQQPVPHSPETSSRFTDRVPPYTLPPSNTEHAPPSYEESLWSATFPLHPPWLLYKVIILSTIRLALPPLNPKFYQCHFLHLMVIQIRHDHERHCVIEAAASENTSINFNFMRIHSLLV